MGHFAQNLNESSYIEPELASSPPAHEIFETVVSGLNNLTGDSLGDKEDRTKSAKVHLGWNLHGVLTEKGYTSILAFQKSIEDLEVEGHIGLEYETLHAIVTNNNRRIDSDVLEFLCVALEVPPYKLITEIDPKDRGNTSLKSKKHLKDPDSNEKSPSQ